ncbi:amino acid ABC transporter ATP-binding protein [Demequina sp. TTPB684]|uniref:amino acid ABC transporter ATP-binding protein n=1 Tax=unclassified Demequina TaxID=2620311 RepID=UPI001CF29AF2|nr:MULTISPECIES: amino acid ABC transporter ATP-binding protein [unclassified Demequina]MCB2412686.1 amino acid ABC transporter ATP-binding protein [Demequina sp. TTPB684]UPU87674.1 amino acid ABC transporter ATP-binding protein [Demequina sp. TMPB413]
MSHTDPTPSSSLLTVEGVSKRFGETEVLRSVDLKVARGEVLAVIGASGSGKTTLLRCLNGLEVPDAGHVTIADTAVDFSARPASRELRALRDRSTMVFQHYHLFPHRTVLENIAEGPVIVQRRQKEQVREEALALLDRVGMVNRAGAYPHELSGGQQQRVGILRALALRPDLLLFDEPTSALDPELVGDVLTLMRDLAAEGWTMVVVTHELQFARDVAQQVAFVDQGRVLEHGEPAQVLRAPREERTRQFVHRLLHPL